MTRSHLLCGRPARIALCALYFLGFLASFCLFATIIQAHAAQLTLAWDPNTDPALAGYKLYWGTSSANYSWSADAGNQTTYAVPELSAGATYYFAATAYDSERFESNFSNETTHTVPATCTYTVSPTSQVLGAGGGTGSITVTGGSTCAWTTSNPSSWVSITSGANGTGNGTAAYIVSSNTGTASRTAGLTIAGKVFTVSQSGAQTTNTITASARSNGTISPSGKVSAANGANQTFTIAPASGFKVANVLVDGSSVGAVSSYTFSSVTANHIITASFAAVTYGLTVSKTGSGSVTVPRNLSSTFKQGTSVTLTAQAGRRSTFVGWSGACSGTSSTCTVLMTDNMTVTATFKP